jgi:L-threonylcarbamoyladenylate synthase
MSGIAHTRVLPADATGIREAAAVLQAGGLVAFPTETVYGLGANARDAAAVAKIFAAKGRPTTDPLIVHVADLDHAASVARTIPPLATQLAQHFWPGPLTLVLPRHPNIPASVSAGLDTVAIRIPAHPVAMALIREAGLPIAAPSANRFTRPSPTNAAHVLADLDRQIDMVLDGGETTIGLESTVLDLSGEHPSILRPGGIDREQLAALIPDLVFVPRFLNHQEATAAPGGLLRHYAPNAPLWLIQGHDQAIWAHIIAATNEQHRHGRRVGILATSEDLPMLAGCPATMIDLGSQQDLATIGRALFGAIRSIDAQGVEIIFVRGLPQIGLGLAIWDRLIRAAEGRVVEV